MKPSARIKANRANAKRSTGPRSPSGKQRVAGNARRHGLAVPVTALPQFDATVAWLARRLVGADIDAQRLELARRAAEAQIDLNRVRAARLALLQGPISDPDYIPRRMRGRGARIRTRITAATQKMSLSTLRALIHPYKVKSRVEAEAAYRAMFGTDFLVERSVSIPMTRGRRHESERYMIDAEDISEELVKANHYKSPRLDEPERIAAVIGDLSSELVRLDRYERRALSRRKFAIRALDLLP